MTSAAIWVTSDEAKIFHFKTSGIETKHLHRHGAKHPSESSRNHKGSDADRFFHDVAEALVKGGAGRWLILGPGQARTHLKAHIEKHHADHAKQIFGVEPLDKATDGEIRDFAHKYFKQKAAFEGA